MASTLETDYDRRKEVMEFEESKIGVKGLVDSGITSIPRIFLHPPQNISDLKPSASSELMRTPIVDLSGLNSSDQRTKIVDQIKEASHTWGFFQVINHGIPLHVMDESINAVRSFHEQPAEIKKKYYARDRKVSFYSNTNLLSSTAANWKDSLRLVSMPPNALLELEDIPTVCGKELMAWEKHSTRLAETLMEVLCEGLGVSAGRLKELSCLDSRTLLCHYYPYCPQSDLTMGLNTHTDKLLLTLLMQSQTGEGGLQVKHGGEWVKVNPIPGAITVDIGDILQIFSNDEYKSAEHRVLANPSREARISIAVFFNPGRSGDSDFYGPMPELLSAEKPALYRKFTVPEIYKHKLSSDVGSKTMIDSFKLPDVTKKPE